MQDHKDRMVDLFKKAPSKKFLDREVRKLPRKQRRYSEKKVKYLLKRLKTIMKSGAGLPMDQLLRSYFEEFNSRLGDQGPESMPTSFNVMEAFFQYNEEDSAFYLLPEKDHIISSVDFIDFITSPDAPDNVYNEIFNVKDNLIHSFNMYDNPHDLTVSTGEKNEYGLKGGSFVKRGEDVSVMLLCGMITDFTKMDTIEFGDPYKPWLKEPIAEYTEQPQKRIHLEDTDDMWRTIALARYNIKTKTEEVRYLYKEYENFFMGIMDDPDVYRGTHHLKAEVKSDIKKFQEDLDKNIVVFELCKMVLLLPAYMNFKITLIKDEKVTTKIGSTPGATKKKPKGKVAKDRVLFRTVSSLRIVNPNRMPSIRNYSPPRFQVEVDGFWRRLDPDALGRGPNNEPVVGRTWVKEHIRWRDKEQKPVTVFVKSKISAARKRAQQITERYSLSA